MVQFILFAVIYGIMMYIWSFVYLNKSGDKINQSFLAFISVILIWMILSVSNGFSDGSTLSLVLKTIYFYSMMSIAVFFMLFIYRFTHKKLDAVFYILAAVNTLTILARYLFPLDYADPTFWRYTDPVVAPIMSGTFCIPVIYSLYLLLKVYRVRKNPRQRAQLRLFFTGILVACLTSVISEYVLPTWFHISTHLSLMYFAVLLLVIFIFLSIMRHKLMNLQTVYIYQRLFMNSSDGIIIINRQQKILCVNDTAREIMGSTSIDAGDRITDYIREYTFEADYKQHEVMIPTAQGERYFSLSQHPIDTEDQDSGKLLTITDITAQKLDQQRERNILIEESSLDKLTGFYNKRYFIENFYTPAARGSGGNRYAVLFIDVDNFKSINDLKGHLTGDRVLRQLAACIRNTIGCDARCVRFGGDEFVVIFENMAVNEAVRVAETIRCRAKEFDFSQHGGPVRISLSIGLAEGPAPVKELVKKADMAMYRSKSGGKDRTTFYTESETEESEILMDHA